MTHTLQTNGRVFSLSARLYEPLDTIHPRALTRTLRGVLISREFSQQFLLALAQIDRGFDNDFGNTNRLVLLPEFWTYQRPCRVNGINDLFEFHGVLEVDLPL